MTPEELAAIREREKRLDWDVLITEEVAPFYLLAEEVEPMLAHIAAQDKEIERLKPNAQMIVNYEQLKIENAELKKLAEGGKKIVKQIINDSTNEDV